MKKLTISVRLAIVGWIFLPMIFAIAFYSYWAIQRSTVTTWASYAGALQAKQHFQERKYRVFLLSEDNRHEFTGESDGPFEVWTWPAYPQMRRFHETEANQTFVDEYNRVIRRMWEKRQSTTSAEPEGGQISSESAPSESSEEVSH